MASSFVTCPANAWTKVATAVTTGTIHKVSAAPSIYLQAYVATGGAAPVGRGVGVPAFKDSITGDTSEISDSSAIDVYLWADGVAGEVRVDI